MRLYKKHTQQFASVITGQTIPQEMTMVSFDVVSLLTKVPIDLATRVASTTK